MCPTCLTSLTATSETRLFQNALLMRLERFCIPSPCSGFHHGFPEAFLTSIKTTLLICCLQSFLTEDKPPSTPPPTPTPPSAQSIARAHMKINVLPRDESMFLKTIFPSLVGVRDKQPLPPSHVFYLSNLLEAHVAFICHSEKVPWSVKWPVDDLRCGAATGTCCPREQGAEKSKSASRPSISIYTLLASPIATSKSLNAP